MEALGFTDNDVIDNVELVALTPKDSDNTHWKGGFKPRFSLQWLMWAAGACFVLLCIRMVGFSQSENRNVDSKSKNNSVTPLQSIGFPIYTCPNISSFESNFNENESSEYTPRDEKILSNLDAYVATFRHRSFDAWSRTFDEYKKDVYSWKSSHFVMNLKTGDAIYESACGTGLNILMTLEIVQQESNGTITNLTFYGNDYVPQSVKIANLLAKRRNFFPSNARLGRICQGNSLNLSYVPSNVFDLVFTGYITPLQNPLDFKYSDESKLLNQYRTICTEKARTREAVLMQQRQDDWFGQWVKEMVRIAKPGASILIEQVSLPFCEILYDWGGVNQSFWTRGAREYGWNVEGIGFGTNKRSRGAVDSERYHVFMRKKNNT